MLSTNGCDLLGLLFCALVLPLLVSCRTEARRAPVDVLFAFGDQYTLVKHGDFIAASSSERWDDAQVPPPADFDETPSTILMTPADFDSIWADLSRIDFSRYADPATLKFRRTPPDQQAREILKYVVDSDTIVDWLQSYQRLESPARDPLQTVVDRLAATLDRCRADLVLPTALTVSLEDAALGQWDVASVESTCQLTRADIAVQLPPRDYKELWRLLIDLRLLGREFSTAQEETPPTQRFRLGLKVNGFAVRTDAVELDKGHSAAIGKLAARLDSLWNQNRSQ